MGIFKRLKDVSEWVDQVVDKEAPRPTPEPKKDTPEDARFVRGAGERIGFAGLAVFTVGAALVGAVGCQESVRVVLPVATCDEPAVWCGGGQR